MSSGSTKDVLSAAKRINRVRNSRNRNAAMKPQDLRAYGAILIFPLVVGAYSLRWPKTPGQIELATHHRLLQVFMAVTLACCIILLVPIRLNKPLYQALSLILACAGGVLAADAWLYSNVLAAGVAFLYWVAALLIFKGARGLGV